MFGSSEGLIGVSPPDDPGIVLASDLCTIELVDEAGRPVPDGTPSHRTLVTNLFNPLQPLIRYELTDSMVRLPSVADNGHARVRVDGRSDETFRYGQVEVHPLAVRTVMVKQAEIVEHQVRQTPRGVDIAVVAGGPVDEPRLTDLLRDFNAPAWPTPTSTSKWWRPTGSNGIRPPGRLAASSR